MEKIFKLKEHGTNIKTEIIAGLSTFATMAYILVLNPSILSSTGMEFSKVFAAVAISSAIACLVMGFLANLPFALSAGVGISVMFASTVCIQMGYSWRWALSAVLVEGLIFIILTLTNIREAIIACIPATLKKAIGAGVGFYIASIGLKNAGIIIADESNLTILNTKGPFIEPLVAIIGVLLIGILLAKKVRGAVLIGILAATVIDIPLGVTTYAGGSYVPPAPYFFDFAFHEIIQSAKTIMDFALVVITLLYFDMFDTLGTLIACAEKTGMVNEDGSIPRAKQALLSDAIGTTTGAVFGTSTITTFVESSTGVAEGGRTGLTAIVVGLMFGLSLFLEPLFGSIPSAATAPALIIVGVMMAKPITDIDFSDYTEAIPAFLTIIIMVCASNIADGILFGILSYVILKVFTGRFKTIRPMTWVITGFFILKIVITFLN